jgi:hypothetical protein
VDYGSHRPDLEHRHQQPPGRFDLVGAHDTSMDGVRVNRTNGVEAPAQLFVAQVNAIYRDDRKAVVGHVQHEVAPHDAQVRDEKIFGQGIKPNVALEGTLPEDQVLAKAVAELRPRARP